jgi:hypothetical protein
MKSLFGASVSATSEFRHIIIMLLLSQRIKRCYAVRTEFHRYPGLGVYNNDVSSVFLAKATMNSAVLRDATPCNFHDIWGFESSTLFSASMQKMKAGGPFGTGVTVEHTRRRHILQYNILFNIVIRKVRRKSTGGWVNIHTWTKGFHSFNTIHLEKQNRGTSFRAWRRYSFTSF